MNRRKFLLGLLAAPIAAAATALRKPEFATGGIVPGSAVAMLQGSCWHFAPTINASDSAAVKRMVSKQHAVLRKHLIVNELNVEIKVDTSRLEREMKAVAEGLKGKLTAEQRALILEALHSSVKIG